MSNDSNFNFAINRLLEQQKVDNNDDGTVDLSTPGSSSSSSTSIKNQFPSAADMHNPFQIPPQFLQRHPGAPSLFPNPAFMFPGLSASMNDKKNNKIDDDESSEPKTPENEMESTKPEMHSSPPWLNYLNIASQLVGVKNPNMFSSEFKFDYHN